jgi:2-deoxy-D-gluconate 3-dehydrogenase
VSASVHPSLQELIDLTGRAALVTGAAQGFGFACARRLAEAGATVLLTDRQVEAVQEAAARLQAAGYSVAAVGCEVTQEGDVVAAAVRCVEVHGSLDILINNAGAYSNQASVHMPLEEFERVMRVNVSGAFLCAQTAARQMIQQGTGGSIINISSIDAIHPSLKGMAHYTASKHAVWGLTKTLALEYGESGIRVNAIAPGPSLTEGVIEYIRAGAPEGIGDIEKHWDTAKQRVPLNRWADPDEIARVAVFLASGLSAYVNGAQIVVDGGFLVG